MTRTEFYAALDGLLEQDAGTLTGQEKLAEIEDWDSLVVLGVIALADERCGVVLAAEDLARCETVDEVAGLVGDKLT